MNFTHIYIICISPSSHHIYIIYICLKPPHISLYNLYIYIYMKKQTKWNTYQSMLN